MGGERVDANSGADNGARVQQWTYIQRADNQRWQLSGTSRPPCGFEWSPGKVFNPSEAYVACDGERLIFQPAGGHPQGQVAVADAAGGGPT